jgi:hypothetical protein
MRTALAVICVFTILATGYLSLSLMILRPPRANYVEWSFMAALFIAQGALTLAAIAGLVTDGRVRWPLVAGAVAIIAVGGSWALSTLSGTHFEGYALVLGSMLVAQGLLTLPVFLTQATASGQSAGLRT